MVLFPMWRLRAYLYLSPGLIDYEFICGDILAPDSDDGVNVVLDADTAKEW
jgi:hypothetical protein